MVGMALFGVPDIVMEPNRTSFIIDNATANKVSTSFKARRSPEIVTSDTYDATGLLLLLVVSGRVRPAVRGHKVHMVHGRSVILPLLHIVAKSI